MWQDLWVALTPRTKSAMPWWMSEMEPWVGIIVISETQTRKEKTNRAHLIAQETVKEQSSAMRNPDPLNKESLERVENRNIIVLSIWHTREWDKKTPASSRPAWYTYWDYFPPPKKAKIILFIAIMTIFYIYSLNSLTCALVAFLLLW